MKSLLKQYMLILAVAIISICVNAENTQPFCERFSEHKDISFDQSVIEQGNIPLSSIDAEAIISSTVINGTGDSPIPLEWEGKAKWYINGKHSFNSLEKISIRSFSEGETFIQGVWDFTINNLNKSLYGKGSAWFKGNYYAQNHKIIISEFGWTRNPTKSGDAPFTLYPLEGHISEELDEIKWNDGYKFFPLQVEEHWGTDFKLGRDNNDFSNDDWDFFGFWSWGNTYQLKSYDFTKKLFNKARTASEISKLQKEMFKSWGGACYGIAATMSMVFEGSGTFQFSREFKDSYHKLSAPKDNEYFRDVLNFLYLSQNLNEFCHSKMCDYITCGNTCQGFDKEVELEVFLKNLVKESKKEKLLSFVYSSRGFTHVVLITGGEFKNNQYFLDVYDMNYKNDIHRMGIAKDFSKFEFGKVDDNYKYLVFFRADKYKGMWNSLNNNSFNSQNLTKNTYVVFDSNNSFNIEDSNGNKLFYDCNTGFSGDLKVLSLDCMDEKLQIQIPPCDSLKIQSISPDIDVMIFDDFNFKAVEGKNIKSIDISLPGDMKLDGKKYIFKAYSSVDEMLNEKESGLGSIYAKAKGEVIIHKGQKTVEATSENKMSHIETEIYQGALVSTGKIKGNHNSVSIDTTQDISDQNLESTGMIIFSKQGYAYRGRPIKPFVSVYVGGKSLKKNKEFKVQYENNVEIGTGKLTVVGVGEYSGTLSAEFPIIPKKVKMKKVSSCKSGFEVTWNSSGPKDGFEIQYDTDPDFRKAKTKKIEDGEASSAQVDGLEIGEEYFVRMRAYKSEAETGKTYNSNWSDVKSVLIYPY